jgi:DNA-binding CsgD family transcriptional regulator
VITFAQLNGVDMISDELRGLVKVHNKIVELSNLYYTRKQALDRTEIESIKKILDFTENMFPNVVVLIYGPASQRMYFSDNVRHLMGYSIDGLANMSDEDFLAGIFPEDIGPVRKCMEEVLSLYKESDYEHSKVRYKIRLRYRKGSGEYVPITYEAITIRYKSHDVDIALITDNSKNAPSVPVDLVIEKKVGNKFVVLQHFVPATTVQATRREEELLDLIKKGFTNQQIAESLNISIHTVKNHKQNLFRKFRAKNSLQLVRILQRKEG